jgi:hypothetical protein
MQTNSPGRVTRQAYFTCNAMHLSGKQPCSILHASGHRQLCLKCTRQQPCCSQMAASGSFTFQTLS